MSPPDKGHGGLVESMLESLDRWLTLAKVAVTATKRANARQHPLVEAEMHTAAAERYEVAAQKAERLAEACHIQATFHRELAGIGRGDATSPGSGG